MQCLSQHEALAGDFTVQLDEFLAEEDAPANVQQYARALFTDIIDGREAIDGCIDRASDNWKVQRMATVDRNILRVAACELLHRPDVPANVAIDEAVEIAKEFGTRESAAFVNGVLDAVIKQNNLNVVADTAPPATP